MRRPIVTETLFRVASPFILRSKKIIAVTFHNVLSGEETDWFKQVINLIHKKYGFIQPKYLDDVFAGKPVDGKVILTFDDGFLSNRFLSEEILFPLGIKGIFFIIENFAEISSKKNVSFRDAYKYKKDELGGMSWSDIGYLLKQGHLIGAHTFSHKVLSEISTEDKKKEIIDSADRIEQKIGVPVRCFAYPFGSCSAIDKESIELAKIRFDFAFTNMRGSLIESPSKHFIYRQNLTPSMPLWFVEAVLDGKVNKFHIFSKFKMEKKFSWTRYNISNYLAAHHCL